MLRFLLAGDTFKFISQSYVDDNSVNLENCKHCFHAQICANHTSFNILSIKSNLIKLATYIFYCSGLTLWRRVRICSALLNACTERHFIWSFNEVRITDDRQCSSLNPLCRNAEKELSFIWKYKSCLQTCDRAAEAWSFSAVNEVWALDIMFLFAWNWLRNSFEHYAMQKHLSNTVHKTLRLITDLHSGSRKKTRL